MIAIPRIFLVNDIRATFVYAHSSMNKDGRREVIVDDVDATIFISGIGLISGIGNNDVTAAFDAVKKHLLNEFSQLRSFEIAYGNVISSLDDLWSAELYCTHPSFTQSYRKYRCENMATQWDALWDVLKKSFVPMLEKEFSTEKVEEFDLSQVGSSQVK
ncbi:MAG: hypothetical protein V1770_02005 [bacterium]